MRSEPEPSGVVINEHQPSSCEVYRKRIERLKEVDTSLLLCYASCFVNRGLLYVVIVLLIDGVSGTRRDFC
jgi:hypothetical protein